MGSVLDRINYEPAPELRHQLRGEDEHEPSENSAFLALEIDASGQRPADYEYNEHKVGWQYATPQDVFVHLFSFLAISDLAHVASVNRGWSYIVNDPSLWRTLDLSHMYSRVDDAFLAHLLSSPRFRELTTLSLEGCSALTDRSIYAIMRLCRTRTLRNVLLTGCVQIHPNRFLDLVRHFPLERLELYKATMDMTLVPEIKALRPHIKLGLLWIQYCASTGQALSGQSQALCRHEENVQNQRGCWGPIRGRIIYDNTSYPRGGNYPREVMYSCQQHENEDLLDPQFRKCEMCEHLFRPPSMFSDLICRTCCDIENLTNKRNWIPLTRDDIKAFSFQDLLNKTIRICDRRNLPDTLQRRLVVPCRLDYTVPDSYIRRPRSRPSSRRNSLLLSNVDVGMGMPGHGAGVMGGLDGDDDMEFEDGHLGLEPVALHQRRLSRHHAPDQPLLPTPRRASFSFSAPSAASSSVSPSSSASSPRIDPQQVPMSVFLDRNRLRLDETVSQVKTTLRRAEKGGDMRALLVFDENDSVEVWSDERIILDGREGEENMTLTVQAWAQARSIIYPFAWIMGAVLFFVEAFRVADPVNHYDGKTDYTGLLYTGGTQGLSTELALLIGLGLLVFLVAFVFLMYRYRETCERIFKQFLVFDILLIYLVGGFVLELLLFARLGLRVEAITFCLLGWNFGVVGLFSLYHPVPPSVHRFYLVALNAIMAIMLVATISQWVIFLCVTVAAVADIASELRPNWRLLSPFLLPRHLELLHETPRIIYQVGPVRLRAADLMWYGLMVGLIQDSFGAMVAAFMAILAGVVLTVFVAPFLGKSFRPLPAAYIFMLLVFLLYGEVMEPYVEQWNALRSPVVVLE